MIAYQITSLSFHAPSGLLAAGVHTIGVQCWRTTPFTSSTSSHTTTSGNATATPTIATIARSPLATLRKDLSSADNSLTATKASLFTLNERVKPAKEEESALLLAIEQLEQQCAHLFTFIISID